MGRGLDSSKTDRTFGATRETPHFCRLTNADPSKKGCTVSRLRLKHFLGLTVHERRNLGCNQGDSKLVDVVPVSNRGGTTLRMSHTELVERRNNSAGFEYR